MNDYIEKGFDEELVKVAFRNPFKSIKGGLDDTIHKLGDVVNKLDDIAEKGVKHKLHQGELKKVKEGLQDVIKSSFGFKRAIGTTAGVSIGLSIAAAASAILQRKLNNTYQGIKEGLRDLSVIGDGQVGRNPNKSYKFQSGIYDNDRRHQ